MKKIFFSSLIFVLSINCSICHASNEDVLFEDSSFVEGDSFVDPVTFITIGDKEINTTMDYQLLFEDDLEVPVKQSISALPYNKPKCTLTTGEDYDAAAVFLNAHCLEENARFTLTVFGRDSSGREYSVSAVSDDGEAAVMNIPMGNFSANIQNEGDEVLHCETVLVGYGADTTPEEGVHLKLSCYDKLPSGGSRLRGLGLLLLSILFAL